MLKDELQSLFDELKKEIADLIEQKVNSAKQIRIANGLSDISERLGLIRAGEFRAGNNKEPGYGFSGVRIAHPSVRYENRDWNVVGVNNDRLQFGISATDGTASFSQGTVQLGEDGLSSTTFGKLISFETQDTEEGWVGGATIHSTSLFGMFAKSLDSETLLDDFEDGTLDAWTTVGSPTIYEDSATSSGRYCCLVKRNHYITKSLEVGGTDRMLCISFKAKTLTPGAFYSLVVDLGDTTIGSGTSYVSDTWQEFTFIGKGSTTSPLTLIIRPDFAGQDILIDDVYYYSDIQYASVGSSSDGFDNISIDATNAVILRQGGVAAMGAYGNDAVMFKKTYLRNQGTGEGMYIYAKGKYLILSWWDGSAARYKYLDMSGTGVTWVYSATEPT